MPLVTIDFEKAKIEYNELPEIYKKAVQAFPNEPLLMEVGKIIDSLKESELEKAIDSRDWDKTCVFLEPLRGLEELTYKIEGKYNVNASNPLYELYFNALKLLEHSTGCIGTNMRALFDAFRKYPLLFRCVKLK